MTWVRGLWIIILVVWSFCYQLVLLNRGISLTSFWHSLWLKSSDKLWLKSSDKLVSYVTGRAWFLFYRTIPSFAFWSWWKYKNAASEGLISLSSLWIRIHGNNPHYSLKYSSILQILTHILHIYCLSPLDTWYCKMSYLFLLFLIQATNIADFGSRFTCLRKPDSWLFSKFSCT